MVCPSSKVSYGEVVTGDLVPEKLFNASTVPGSLRVLTSQPDLRGAGHPYLAAQFANKLSVSASVRV